MLLFMAADVCVCIQQGRSEKRSVLLFILPTVSPHIHVSFYILKEHFVDLGKIFWSDFLMPKQTE